MLDGDLSFQTDPLRQVNTLAHRSTDGLTELTQTVTRRTIIGKHNHMTDFLTTGRIVGIVVGRIILFLNKEDRSGVNRKVSLDIDDMIATGIATQVTAGLPGQFGAFNNDANMAVQLGFKSFTRGGYTFHKHDWKLLNDPTLGALSGGYKGALVPLTTVADARTGQKAPALEMNYKASNNYSRDIEHFVTGSILGYATDGDDVARFNYRSECNLVTRAANQHVIIK